MAVCSLPYLKYDDMVSTIILFIPCDEKQLYHKMKGWGKVWHSDLLELTYFKIGKLENVTRSSLPFRDCKFLYRVHRSVVHTGTLNDH
jgi:hypothetical protein